MEKINLYEFIGIIMGDGCIRYSTKKRVYSFELVGDVDEHKEYFDRISDLIFSLASRRPKIWVRYEKLGRSLRLMINCKKFVEFLLNDLRLQKSPKTFRTRIPKKFLDWNYSKHIIRGLFETDGSLYFSKSKKGKYPNYPRLEIKSSSEVLLKQLLSILSSNGFNPHIIRSNTDRTHRILLSGEKMLEKWHNDIGFNTIKNLSKYQFYKKKGHYIPYLSMAERLITLKREWPSG